MAQNPLIKRYLDAGMAFTQMTQARAEAIVKELVKAGEVQAQRTEELVTALVERSRQNTEKLLDLVRHEVREQLASLGVTTKDEGARGESKSPAAGASKKTATKKKSAAKKSAPKKSTAKKSTPKKATAKKSAAKKRSATKKSAAKKKSATKKSAAKKAATKKSSGNRSSS